MKALCLMNNRGFTLVEVMLALFLSSIAFTLFFSFFLYNTDIYRITNYEMTIQEESNNIMELLTIFAKESSNIEQNSGGTAEADPKVYEFTRTVDGAFADVHVMFNPTLEETPLEVTEFTLDPDSNLIPAETFTFRFVSGFAINNVSTTDAAGNTHDLPNQREILLVGSRDKEFKRFSTIITMRNAP